MNSSHLNTSKPAPTTPPLTSSQKMRVIDSLWTFFAAVVVIGPFALPLLWRNPRLNTRNKILGSGVIIVLTLFLIWFSGKTTQHTLQQIEQLNSILQNNAKP